jgi:hypothetical protein
MPALGFALSIGLVCNGLSRPFFGLLSGKKFATTNYSILYTAKGGPHC